MQIYATKLKCINAINNIKICKIYNKKETHKTNWNKYIKNVK